MNRQKDLPKEFQKAYEQWLAEESQFESDSKEPEACKCGAQLLHSVTEPEENAFYCDGLYLYIAASNVPRKIKIDGTYMHFTSVGRHFYCAGPCPERTNTIKSAQIQKVKAKYLTIDGRPMDFESFEVESDPAAIEKAKAFDGASRLFIGGPPGRGKTHLARGIYISLLQQYKNAKWLTAPDLAELFRKSNTSHGDFTELAKAKEEYQDSLACDCLFIDDLGEERKTESDLFQEQFKLLIEKRMGGMVITTNLNSEDIKTRYHEKIFDRLFTNAITITMRGENYRAKTFPNLKVMK